MLKIKAWDNKSQKELPVIAIDQLAKFNLDFSNLELMYSLDMSDNYMQELFSGDIVEVTYQTIFGRYREITQIRFNKEHMGYEPFVNTFDCDECNGYLHIINIKKLGNIYKNKELLEDK